MGENDREDASAPTTRGAEDTIRRLLLVEDEALVARATVRMLTVRGWTCTHTSSAGGALTELDSDVVFHAAIVDLDLREGGRGETVLERLVIHRPPVASLVVSGVARAEDASKIALVLGFPVLEKPVHADILCATLDLEVRLTSAVAGRALAGLHARAERDLLRRIAYALRAAEGNQSEAARLLDIPRTTLREKLAGSDCELAP